MMWYEIIWCGIWVIWNGMMLYTLLGKRGNWLSYPYLTIFAHSVCCVCVCVPGCGWVGGCGVSQVTLYTAGHLHTAVPHCSHSRAPIVHTAVPRENNEHGCVYLRCRAVCKLPGCVEGHPWVSKTMRGHLGSFNLFKCHHRGDVWIIPYLIRGNMLHVEHISCVITDCDQQQWVIPFPLSISLYVLLE